jgi:hypothetical protein
MSINFAKILKENKWKAIITIYGILLISFIYIYLRFESARNSFDIGALVFSIALVLIIHFWGLEETKKASDEQIAELRKVTMEQIEVIRKSTQEQINVIKESTKQQVDSFVVQCQGIINALQTSVGAIRDLSEDLRKQREDQENAQRKSGEQFGQFLIASQREAQLKMDEKQRMKPRISARIAQERFLFIFQHYYIYVFNTGGIAKKLNLTYAFVNPPYKSAQLSVLLGDLDRDTQARPIDCGDISTFTAYHSLEISVQLRDKEDRLYVGFAVIDKTNRDWVPIELQERSGE